ncbi:MAG: serine hydrolase [Cyanobacteria bacterium P01_F01_bin.53]
MSGFWYSLAIASSFSAILSLSTQIHSHASLLQASLPFQARGLTRNATNPGFEPGLEPELSEEELKALVDEDALVRNEKGSKQATQSAATSTNKSRWMASSSLTGPLGKGGGETVVGTVETVDAEENYRRAMELANQGVIAYQSARKARETGNLRESLTLTQRERFLWRESLKQLQSIPQGAVLFERAIAKRTQYRRLLATAESKLSTTDGLFITNSIEAAGVDPQGVHLTLCQIGSASGVLVSSPVQQGRISGELCRHHQGDELMASAASLIKVPIAISLLHKADTENIDLDEPTYVDFSNFTEDAEGTKIQVEETYPLRQIMAHMIDQSNNVATNQLIDYLGRDYIEQTLKEMGYSNTYAGHKLAGDVIMPADPGDLSNQATTHDITAMMVDVYSLKIDEHSELIKALSAQSDQELGYTALQDMGPAVEWLGEKTGQNDLVLATTLAVKIGEERYALTMAMDYSGDVHGMRETIRSVVTHILETGPLVSHAER